MGDGGINRVSGQSTPPQVDSTNSTDQTQQTSQTQSTPQTSPSQPRDQFERAENNRIQNLTQNQDRPLSQQELEQTYNQIKTHLSYSLTDWAVTDKNVADVIGLLDRLPPDQFRQTLKRMNRDGILQRLTDNMEPQHRQAFLHQAVQKGYIQTQSLPPTPQGWGDPPNPPIPYRNDANLPAPIRQLIHDQNIDGLNQYNQAYTRYMERYQQAVENAQTVTDIRRMGPPAKYFYREHPSFIEPGVLRNHPDYDKFLNDRIDRWDSSIDMTHLLRIHHEIGNKVAELNGRRPAGDVWFKAQVSRNGGQLGVRLSTEKGVELESPAFKNDLQRGPVQVEGEISTGGQSKGSVRIGTEHGPGVQVSTDGNVELTGPQTGPARAYAFYNPTNQEFGEGVKIETKGDVEIQLELGMRGISPEEVRAAIDPKSIGFFDTPPELSQGIRWQDLPADVRNHYQNILGWTENEWNTELALLHSR